MIKLLIISFFMIAQGFAQVASGELLRSNDYNNSVFRIGDVKTSVLTLSEFQSLHGSCWIQLNQNVSDIDISGSDLASLKSQNSLKSSYGRVLRSEGTNSASLGQQQEDGTAVNGLSVDHENPIDTSDGTGYTYVWARAKGNWGSKEDLTSGTTSNFSDLNMTEFNHNHSLSSSDPETRMMNLTVNTFVKINNSCL